VDKESRWETYVNESLRVGDAAAAREIAIEAAKAMWRYTIPSSFCEVEYDKKARAWNVEVDYFERKLNFRIDAKTGNVSAFKINKATEKK
jgi:hypothetical protein